MKHHYKRKFSNNDIIDLDDDEWDFLRDLCPNIRDGEEMIATRLAGAAAVLACDAHLQGIVAPNLADIDAAKEAGKPAAYALWPPPSV